MFNPLIDQKVYHCIEQYYRELLKWMGNLGFWKFLLEFLKKKKKWVKSKDNIILSISKSSRSDCIFSIWQEEAMRARDE